MVQIVMEIGKVALCSLFSLIVMFCLTRLGGKRQIAQMSPFDYANSITVGSIAAEMATNLEQWYRPFSALLVYGIITWFVHWSACRSIALRKLWSGNPLVLMQNGTILKDQLRRTSIDLNEFLGQARIAGYFDLNDVQAAMLETNGQISFLPKSNARPANPEDLALHPQPAALWTDLVLDGHVLHQNLKKAGKDIAWLQQQLHAQGIGQTSEVFYAACSDQNDFFACRGR